MGGHGSGGANRKSAAAHILTGTFRPDRHARPAPADEPVSPTDRRRTLAGLSAASRRLAGKLLDEFGPWSAADLHTLRQYAVSCARLAELTDDGERRREVRANLALLKALRLEK